MVLTSFVSIVKTMTTDVVQRLTDYHIPCYNVNLHCQTNDLKYGNGTVMNAVVAAGDIAYFDKVDLFDIYVQNNVGGANGTMVAVGTVPSEFVKKQLGLQ